MFNRAQGLPYRRFFRRLHNHYLFDWYLEIGCRSGKVFGQARGNTVAVDPFFKVEQNVIRQKPALHIFQTTSDEFFEGGFLIRNGIRVSVAFLDGMHLFEYLLRDFIGAELHAAQDGVILMHDCCPFSYEMCTRDLDNLPKGAWTGDVWKLIPILREFRPDLKVEVLDCNPTGLVIVSNLDPESRVLTESYAEIVARYTELDLDTFGLDRFYELFEFTTGQTYLDGDSPFTTLALDAAEHRVPEAVSP